MIDMTDSETMPRACRDVAATGTTPSCPVCAAVTLKGREGGALSAWDIADRLQAIRADLDARGALEGAEGSWLQIAADCLRTMEYREPQQ